MASAHRLAGEKRAAALARGDSWSAPLAEQAALPRRQAVIGLENLVRSRPLARRNDNVDITVSATIHGMIGDARRVNPERSQLVAPGHGGSLILERTDGLPPVKPRIADRQRRPFGGTARSENLACARSLRSDLFHPHSARLASGRGSARPSTVRWNGPLVRATQRRSRRGRWRRSRVWPAAQFRRPNPAGSRLIAPYPREGWPDEIANKHEQIPRFSPLARSAS
jgi:hypothetical protein